MEAGDTIEGGLEAFHKLGLPTTPRTGMGLHIQFNHQRTPEEIAQYTGRLGG